MADSAPGEPPYYGDYLQLDRLLSAQQPITAAHDELLFIVVHQAFELWFKQILLEIDAVLAVMGRDHIAEHDMGKMVSHLVRITTIQRLLLTQIEVLETMTPLDFLEFRDQLVPASGLQSVQFRLIENKLGLDRGHRLNIHGEPYTAPFSPEHAALIEASESAPTLHDHLERWLARVPFLAWGNFDFTRAYRRAVTEMLQRDRMIIETHPRLHGSARSEQLGLWAATSAEFDGLFDPEAWAAEVDEGRRRLSHRAFLAALFINLYRDEPILQTPFRFLSALVDIDELFTVWRQRHALLAHRMIGGRIGTGGTSGRAYLDAAVRRHRIFTDLFDLPTFFIPRSALPPLPPEAEQVLDFRYRRPG
jgi:tryptophan 2,3-dioxygenase